jgi:outer membrane immunogenic protein
MRRIIAATAALLTATLPSLAADMPGPPVLRGAMPAEAGIDWSGFYAGAFVGYNENVFNARSSVFSPAAGYASTPYGAGGAHLARTNDRTHSSSMPFGVYIGHNWSVDGAVFGFEADYSRARLKSGSVGSRSGTFSDGTNDYAYTTNVSTTMNVLDYGSIRARAGMPFGAFLPYITGGLAWARTETGNSASLQGGLRPAGSAPGTPYTADPAAPGPLSTAMRTQMHYGYVVGAGIEFALSSNIVVRGEATTMRFTNFGGHKSIDSGLRDGNMSINTARVGAAVKF